MELDFKRQLSQDLTAYVRHVDLVPTRIQNLGCTQVESMLNIMMVRVDNVSFRCNLTFEICISEGSGPATGGLLDFQSMSP